MQPIFGGFPCVVPYFGCLACAAFCRCRRTNPSSRTTPSSKSSGAKASSPKGPAYGPDGCIYFSDIGNRIMKFDPGDAARRPSIASRAAGPTGSTSIRRAGSSPAKGPTPAATAASRVTEKDGTVRVLADKWKGKTLQQPQRPDHRHQGPRLLHRPALRRRRAARDRHRERLPHRPRRHGDADHHRRQKPNGIILSPDMKTLYLADNNPKGNRHLLSYPLKEDGTVGRQEGAARLRQGPRHRRHVHRRQGQHLRHGRPGQDRPASSIFDPEGKKIGFIPTPETPTNCVFGGTDRKMLYVTAGKSLYRIRAECGGLRGLLAEVTT